jgi:uncharacterized protein YjbI with pentapeptide repeats
MTSSIDGNENTKPENNPWYLLATLYGPPSSDDTGLQERNRIAWNRYLSKLLLLKNDCRLLLSSKAPQLIGDLEPFTHEALAEISAAFTERCIKANSRVTAGLPDMVLNNKIDLSRIVFDNCLMMNNFIFPGEVDFSNVIFKKAACFKEAVFCDVASFEGTTFSSRTDFRRVTFSSIANFAVATFSDLALFQHANFSGPAHFHQGTFSGVTHFHDATFSYGANFRGVAFSATTHFEQTNFLGYAEFRDTSFLYAAFFHGAKFDGLTRFTNAKCAVVVFKGAKFCIAEFRGAIFSQLASFDDAAFSDSAQFDHAAFGSPCSFVNAEMKGPTSFEAANFRSEPPRFFGAKLHEGTVWRHVHWPIPSIQAEAGPFVDAYERLKLEMDRLKKHEDELDFFALELQSRRVLAGGWRGLPIAIYGLLCDYRRSYVRPLVGLLVTVLVGALLCISYFGLSRYPRAFGLSVANTFDVFGFRKDFVDPHIIESLSRFLQIVSAFQTLVGIVLLFFFGLAVRNRFRMK